LGIAAYLFSIGETTYGLILMGLILPQMHFQATLLLPDPIQNDVKYQAQSQPFWPHVSVWDITNSFRKYIYTTLCEFLSQQI
jgi:hypothetical protein